MEKELVKSLIDTFQDHSNTTDNGIEFWFARNIQHLLGYSEWRNFTNVITKAKTSCEASGNNISDHFVDVNKTISIPKEASKEIEEIGLLMNYRKKQVVKETYVRKRIEHR